MHLWALTAAVLAAAGVSGAGAAAPDGERSEQAPIRVAVANIAAAAEWKQDRPVGAMVDIWEELARRLGRDTRYVREDKFMSEIAALTDGTADVALGPMAITEKWERVVDLTHAVVHSGLRVAAPERRDTGFLTALRELPVRQILGLLATVLVLAVASGHLLWWFERGDNNGCFPDRYPRGVWEAVWWIASTIVTGGCDDKHVDSVLGRLIAFSWMIGGIVLVAAFTGVLTATMTAERVTGSIHGPRDLPGRVVGCQEQSVVVDSLRARGALPREFPGIQEALDALQKGEVEAVVSENQQLVTLLSRPERGGLALVGPMFEPKDFGIGLPTDSPLREELNAAILQMREDGTLDEIMTRWFGRHE
jgi:polar amino acid transport system substrate-binding protein